VEYSTRGGKLTPFSKSLRSRYSHLSERGTGTFVRGNGFLKKKKKAFPCKAKTKNPPTREESKTEGKGKPKKHTFCEKKVFVVNVEKTYHYRRGMIH